MAKYDDIINTNWQGIRTKERMQRAGRAKIFSSFAALKGYEEAVDEKSQMRNQSDEMAEMEIERVAFEEDI